MEPFRIPTFSFAMAIGFLLFAVPAAAPASTRPHDDATSRAWMPDVAERLESLRERAEQAADDARARERSEKLHPGQWWRFVAAVPAPDRVR